MNALAKIHIAKKQLGMADDDYRALLARVTGKTSSAEMSEEERGTVVAEMVRMGFEPSSKPSRSTRKKLTGKYAAKLQALWIAAWNLGIVKNRDDAALLAFVKRQTGIDHTRFLHYAEDATKAIEALKGWMEREADVSWRPIGDHAPIWTDAHGYRIAIAQWVICVRLFPDLEPGFQGFAERIAGKPVPELQTHDWIPVMNELGQLIRKGQDVA